MFSATNIPILETERLILRAFDSKDTDAYTEMVADEDVSQFISLVGKPMNRLEAWRSMAMQLGHWQLRGFGQWAVEEKASGDFVVRLGLYYPESWPGQELGYALARTYWGKGYATEGAAAARDFAFNALGWDELISIISPLNLRSQGVAERLGETFREIWHFDDMVLHIYALTRADWETLNREP